MSDISDLQALAAEIQQAADLREQLYDSPDTANQALTAAGFTNLDPMRAPLGNMYLQVQGDAGLQSGPGGLFEYSAVAINDSLDYLQTAVNPDPTGMDDIRAAIPVWRAARDQFFALMQQDVGQCVLVAQNPADAAISIAQAQLAQAIRVQLAVEPFTSIRKLWAIEIVVPSYDANGDWTGGFDSAGDQYAASAVTPSVLLTVNGSSPNDDGTVTVELSGLISDGIADIVANNAADITAVHVFVNAQEADGSPFAVQRGLDSPDAVRPYAFTGEFSATFTFTPLDGDNVIRAVTEPNAVSEVGEGRAILSVSNPDAFSPPAASPLILATVLPLMLTPPDLTIPNPQVTASLGTFSPGTLSGTAAVAGAQTWSGSLMVPTEAGEPEDQSTLEFLSPPQRHPAMRDFCSVRITSSLAALQAQPFVLCESDVDSWSFRTASVAWPVNGPPAFATLAFHLLISKLSPQVIDAIGLYQGTTPPAAGPLALAETGSATNVFTAQSAALGDVTVELAADTGFDPAVQNQVGVRLSSTALGFSQETLVLFETAPGSGDFATIVRNIVPGASAGAGGQVPGPVVNSADVVTASTFGRMHPLRVRLSGQVDVTEPVIVRGNNFAVTQIGGEYFADAVFGVFGGEPVVKPAPNLFNFKDDSKFIARYKTVTASADGSDVKQIDVEIGSGTAAAPDKLLFRSQSTTPPRTLVRVLAGESAKFTATATDNTAGKNATRFLVVDKAKIGPLVFMDDAKADPPAAGPDPWTGSGPQLTCTFDKPGRYSVFFYIDLDGDTKFDYKNEPAEFIDVTVHERRDITLALASGPAAFVRGQAAAVPALLTWLQQVYDQLALAKDAVQMLADPGPLYVHFVENPGKTPIGGLLRVTTSKSDFLAALGNPRAYVMAAGHSHYGLGLSFGTNATPEDPNKQTFAPVLMSEDLAIADWWGVREDGYLDSTGSKLNVTAIPTVVASDVTASQLGPGSRRYYQLKQDTQVFKWEANLQIHDGIHPNQDLTIFTRGHADLTAAQPQYKLLYVQSCNSDFWFYDPLSKVNPGTLLLAGSDISRDLKLFFGFVSLVHAGAAPADMAKALDGMSCFLDANKVVHASSGTIQVH